MQRAASISKLSPIKTLGLFWLGILGVYAAWLMVFWPGVLGNDSMAILMAVDTGGRFSSGKSALWFYAVQATYGLTGRAEVAVFALQALCALIAARMLSWYWQQGRRWLTLGLLVFIVLAPHMLYFTGTLYPDALFAMAACGLMFELWLCAQRGRVSHTSLAMLALTLPLALALRSNGVIFWLPVLGVAWLLQGRARWLMLGASGLALALSWGAERARNATPQSALFSLALFETVHYMRPHATDGFWAQYPFAHDPWVLSEPRVSPQTRKILQRYSPPDKLQAFSDPAYWDGLVFPTEGPQLLQMSEADRAALVREFLRHNLWQNLPAFLGNRVTVFATAALAQGSFPALDYAPYVLPNTQAKSNYRRFELAGPERVLRQVHQASYQARWLLWSPLLGMAMALLLLRRRHGTATRLIGLGLLLQLGGIFAFASAGEYRYLLLFFMLPLPLSAMLMQPPKP